MMTTDVCQIFKLMNPIQNYAWGSRTAIAELLGNDAPADDPQAELWMGAHPKAPSRVKKAGQTIPLTDLIEAHSEAILGSETAQRFNGRMPFLFKVLAAAAPLSVQAHPDEIQARSGFERENRLGIPIDAPHRNYRDDSHKPEIICALTPFWGLNGFQPPAAIIKKFETFGPRTLSPMIARLAAHDTGTALKDFFTTLLETSAQAKHELIAEVTARARDMAGRSAEADWILKLNRAYPGDIGILAPLFLHLVGLMPGQAMYLSAGQLHAYLEGVGIELMANSDNVLRGGLTPKHIDVPELTRVLRFNAAAPRIITPQADASNAQIYTTHVDEFALARIDTSADHDFVAAPTRSIEILLVIDGTVVIAPAGDGAHLSLVKGESVLVPACLEGYSIRGAGRIFRASVPLSLA